MGIDDAADQVAHCDAEPFSLSLEKFGLWVFEGDHLPCTHGASLFSGGFIGRVLMVVRYGITSAPPSDRKSGGGYHSGDVRKPSETHTSGAFETNQRQCGVGLFVTPVRNQIRVFDYGQGYGQLRRVPPGSAGFRRDKSHRQQEADADRQDV